MIFPITSHFKQKCILPKNSVFDNIFIGTDSSSYARQYYNELKNDKTFMNSVYAWEALHIASSPSYSLASGLINKSDFYETVLFDLLDISSSGSVVSVIDKSKDYLSQIKNTNVSYVVGTAKKIMAAEEISESELKQLKWSGMSEDSINLLTKGTKYAGISEVTNDVLDLLSDAKDVYEGICAVANYFSIKELLTGTNEILTYIINDTENDFQLRHAAQNVLDCYTSAYNKGLVLIQEGTFYTLEVVLGKIVDDAWKSLVAMIPGGAEVLLGLKGARAICNILFSTDKEIKGFYLLETSVKMEDAIIRALSSAQTDMKNNSKETAAVYMQGISMYKNIIVLGFDYSIDLLEVAAKSGFNTSTDFLFGNSSKCYSLISAIESFKKK